jgi:phosphatidylserine/phosphatidylglycerophosphate/cardiolipin synthase-like enzyme
MIEPQIESQGFSTHSDQQIMRRAIERFVEDKAKSLRIEELADALDSPAETMELFLEHIRAKGIAGDPIGKD